MTGGVPDGSTPVTIFGRTYSLRGGGDPAHLHRLASEVDRRMREVADATGTADTLKVAILAALNIADDYLRNRRAGVDNDAQARLVLAQHVQFNGFIHRIFGGKSRAAQYTTRRVSTVSRPECRPY